MSEKRRAVAKESADKYIAACVVPGTLRGYKKEWVKWLTFARTHIRRFMRFSKGSFRH
jgi:hypothetical protein